MTQLLNRLISVKGESTVTGTVDTRYFYGNKSGVGVYDVGAWEVLDKLGYYAERPATSTDLVSTLSGDAAISLATYFYQSGDRIKGLTLPFPKKLEDEVPLTIRFHGGTDADYVEGIVTKVSKRLQLQGAEEINIGWILHLDDPVVAHGNVFQIINQPPGEPFFVDDALVFSFVGRGDAQPTTEATKEVWAQLRERGADVGLVIGELGSGEGAQETITATIRYDPALTIAKEFTDDLARRWFATSTRTTSDRRYLAIEGVRHITGIDLPEFGADS